jgi:hypothetical protein
MESSKMASIPFMAMLQLSPHRIENAYARSATGHERT